MSEERQSGGGCLFSFVFICIGVLGTLGYQGACGDTPEEAFLAAKVKQWEGLMDAQRPNCYRPEQAVELAIKANLDATTYLIPAIHQAYNRAMELGEWDSAINVLRKCDPDRCTDPLRQTLIKRAAYARYQEDKGKTGEAVRLTANHLIAACKDGLVRYPPVTADANALYDSNMSVGDLRAAFDLASACLLGPEKTTHAAQQLADRALKDEDGYSCSFHNDLQLGWETDARIAMCEYQQAHRDEQGTIYASCPNSIMRMWDDNVDPAFIGQEIKACMNEHAPTVGDVNFTQLQLANWVNAWSPEDVETQATAYLLSAMREYEHGNHSFIPEYFHMEFDRLERFEIVGNMNVIRPAAIRAFAGAFVRHLGGIDGFDVNAAFYIADWSERSHWRRAWKDHERPEMPHQAPDRIHFLTATDAELFEAIEAQACALIPGYQRTNRKPCPPVAPCDPREAWDDCDADGAANGVDSCPLQAMVDGLDADCDRVDDACDPCPDDAKNICDAAEFLDDWTRVHEDGTVDASAPALSIYMVRFPSACSNTLDL